MWSIGGSFLDFEAQDGVERGKAAYEGGMTSANLAWIWSSFDDVRAKRMNK
jgi:hypothetical protein